MLKEKYLALVTALVLVMVFGFSFAPAFQKMMIRWNSEDNNYCFLVVPLFLYLCWNLRAAAGGKGETALSKGGGFRFDVFSWSRLAVIPTFLAVGLLLLGEIVSVETFLYTGIWMAAVSAAVLFYGTRAWHLVYPLLVLFFIIPLPPFLNRTLTFKLKMASSFLSEHLLRLSGISVFREGNIIDLGADKLQVVDACSGLRYFMPLILMALLIGYFFSNGLWRRAVLLAVVIPLAIVINSIRIYTTGLLTIHGYQKLAQSFFHDVSGWLAFMIAAGILILISKALNSIGPGTTEADLIDPGAYPVGLARPLLLTALFCTLFLLVGWTLRSIPSAQNLPSRITFDSFPTRIGEWEGKRHYLSRETMEQLWADDYISATYVRPGHAHALYLFIPFYEYQSTRHTAHAPQACMLGSGYSIAASKDHTFALIGNETLTMRTMLLQKGSERLLAGYFFFQRGRVILSPWMNKLYLMMDAISKRRTDGALVRAELVMAPGQSVAEAYGELEGFMREVWGVLPEFIPS